ISRAVAVRRAVDRLLKENSGRDQDAAFGLWKGRRINASAHVTKLRREWDRP
ncbi:MAG: CopG family transcriptional regulator, partial [Burkholderiales bacterium PBB4]